MNGNLLARDSFKFCPLCLWSKLVFEDCKFFVARYQSHFMWRIIQLSTSVWVWQIWAFNYVEQRLKPRFVVVVNWQSRYQRCTRTDYPLLSCGPLLVFIYYKVLVWPVLCFMFYICFDIYCKLCLLGFVLSWFHAFFCFIIVLDSITFSENNN